MANAAFFDAIKTRRSTVQILDTSPISEDTIIQVVQQALLYAPSPFHIQGCRAVVLLGDEHRKLWDLAHKAVSDTLPPEVMVNIEPKIKAYRGGFGTVMFFEDSEAANALPSPLKALCDKYPEWHEHSQGMNQFIVWTALANHGLGCSLQHYQPSINTVVAAEWPHPASWVPKGQLVFGTPNGPPRGGVEKKFLPINTRVKVFGKKNELGITLEEVDVAEVSSDRLIGN